MLPTDMMTNALLVASRTGTAEKGGWGPVGRLDFDGTDFRFVYTRGAETLEGFRPFPGMDNLETIYRSNELFPVFANRMMPKSRPDYEAYLRWSGFDPASPPAPIQILGVTEGIRVTDPIELFPCPVPDENLCYTNKFFLHGLRWIPGEARDQIAALKKGEPLFLMPDVSNEADPTAVAIRTGGEERYLIGYFPRYLAHDVSKLLGSCSPDFMEVSVERVNLDAPLQQRLLCQLHACWPEGFQPCSGPEFEPISESFAESFAREKIGA